MFMLKSLPLARLGVVGGGQLARMLAPRVMRIMFR